jgi:acetyl esterase/lipase
MKTLSSTILSLLLLTGVVVAQELPKPPDAIKDAFPAGTVFHSNIAYAGDTLKKHLLDIYLPPGAKGNVPLVIWVHGGGWMHNDKYADMGYMKGTIKAILEKGYGLASIDYRHSTTAIFPAQIRDCIQAVQFLHDHAADYKIDRGHFALMGFSAGGHLASLLALSHNNQVTAFYPGGRKPTFTIKSVIDFYGPSEFLLFYGNMLPTQNTDPISVLLGASPLVRPDIAKLASPATYVDKADPPFFIVHGEKDPDVPTAQSYLLKSWLDLSKVRNSLTVIKDAPHYGTVFDTEPTRVALLAFLDSTLR